MANSRPELTFGRITTTWRFWALGFHRYSTAKGTAILCVGIGPLRLHFIDWDRSKHG